MRSAFITLLATQLVVLVFGATAVASDEPILPQSSISPARRAAMVDHIRGLRIGQMELLFAHLGAVPDDGFYDCLCHEKFYSPGPGGPCLRIGPAYGGHTWHPFSDDAELWDICVSTLAEGVLETMEREVNELYAPSEPPSDLAAGTTQLPEEPTGPYVASDHPLRERFRQLEALCLPVPHNYNELFEGPLISQYWREELLAEVNAMFEEPRTICDQAIEAKLLLDGERGRYLSDIVASAAWELWGPDQWTGYQSVAQVGEAVFTAGANQLSSTIDLLGKLDDARAIIEMLDEEYQTHRRNERAREVANEFRNSAEMTREQLEERVLSLRSDITTTSDEINDLQRELAERIDAVWPSDDIISNVGGPFVPNTRIPNEAPAWQEYFREADALTREYRARMSPLFFEMTELEMRAHVLRDYRMPLNTMTCEEFIESRRGLCEE